MKNELQTIADLDEFSIRGVHEVASLITSVAGSRQMKLADDDAVDAILLQLGDDSVGHDLVVLARMEVTAIDAKSTTSVNVVLAELNSHFFLFSHFLNNRNVGETAVLTVSTVALGEEHAGCNLSHGNRYLLSVI